MSFGYNVNGGMNDYCCMDAHSASSFIYHHPNHHHPATQPPLPVPPSTTIPSDLSNANGHTSLNLVTSHALSGVVPKQPVFNSPHKNLHLSQFIHGKDVSSCLTTLGHERALHHSQGGPLSQDKLTSDQINNLVSDIFRSDLQYHTSNDQQQHQQQQHQQQQQQQQQQPPSHQEGTLPPPLGPPNAKKRKRNRKTKDPSQRKIKPPGTHMPREEIKRRRLRGEQYITRSGKIVKKKVFDMVDCQCRRMCSDRVPLEVRRKIFEEFHSMADWNGQTQFIVASIVVTDTKRKSKKMQAGESEEEYKSRRSTSRMFYLTNQRVQVCKTVFMSTLGITTKRVDYALRHKAIPMTAIATTDRRGRGPSRNKTPAQTEDRIRAHINSFPTASHSSNSSSGGSGASSSKSSGSKAASSKSKSGGGSSGGKSTTTALHLPPDLTITKMYQMYQEQCERDGVAPASMWVYTKIMHAESKFRTAPHRSSSQHSSNAQSSSASASSTSTGLSSCRCCERSYTILTSGEPPEKIVQLLMKEHHDRLSSSYNASMAAQFSSSAPSFSSNLMSSSGPKGGKSKKTMSGGGMPKALPLDFTGAGHSHT